jgi:hypothetical protein
MLCRPWLLGKRRQIYDFGKREKNMDKRYIDKDYQRARHNV